MAEVINSLITEFKAVGPMVDGAARRALRETGEQAAKTENQAKKLSTTTKELGTSSAGVSRAMASQLKSTAALATQTGKARDAQGRFIAGQAKLGDSFRKNETAQGRFTAGQLKQREAFQKNATEMAAVARKLTLLTRQEELALRISRKHGTEIQATRRAVKMFGSDLAAAGRQAGKYAGRLGVAQQEVRRLAAEQRRAAGASGGLTRALRGQAIALVGLAAGYLGIRQALRGIGAAAGIFTSLEDELLGTQAVTGATASQMARLEEQTRALGASTPRTAVEVAGLQQELARAGFSTGETLASSKQLIAFASAGQLDLAEATGVSATILRAFDADVSELSRITDVLATSASSAKTDITQLSEGMKFASSAAASLDESIEQTSAALAVIQERGLQGGLAGRGLRTVFKGLTVETDKSAAVLDELGLKFSDVNLEMEDLLPVIQLLAERNINFGQSVRLVGTEGAAALLNLTRGAEKFGEITIKNMDESAGATLRMAAIMESGLGGAARELRSATEGVAIALAEGMSPALNSTAEDLTVFLQGNQAVAQQLGEGIAVAATVAGKALLVVGAGVVLLADNSDLLLAALVAVAAFYAGPYVASALAAAAAQGAFAVATTAATAALARFNVAMLANPFGLVAVALVAVVAILSGGFRRSIEQSDAAIRRMTAGNEELIESHQRLTRTLAAGNLSTVRQDLKASSVEVLKLSRDLAILEKAFSESFLVEQRIQIQEQIDDVNAALQRTSRETQLLTKRETELARVEDERLQLGIKNFDQTKLQTEAEVASAVALAEIEKATKGINDELAKLGLQADIMRELGAGAEEAGQAATLVLASGMELSRDRALELVRALKEANAELALIAAAREEAFNLVPTTLTLGAEFTNPQAEGLLPLPADARGQVQDSEAVKQAKADLKNFVAAIKEGQDARQAAVDLEVEAILDGSDRLTSVFDDLARTFSSLDSELGNLLAGLASGAGDLSSSLGALKAARASGGGGLFSAESRQAGSATAGLIGAAGGALGLFGGGTSIFGGEKSGTFGAEGAQLGGLFGPVGALFGTVIGSFFEKAGDEALIIVEQMQGAAGGAVVKIEKAEGGLAEIAQVISASIAGFIDQFESITGEALNAAVAGISIEIVDDLITVQTSTGTKGFRDLGEALGFVAERLLIANEAVDGFMDGLGENVQRLISGFTGPVQRGTFEEIVAALDLAGRADALAAGAMVPPEVAASFREIIALREQEVALARQFGLNMSDVLELSNQRLQQTRDSIAAAGGQFTGVSNVLQGLQAVTASMEAFGDATAAEAASRLVASESVALRVQELQQQIHTGLEEAVGGTVAAGTTLSDVMRDILVTGGRLSGVGAAVNDLGIGISTVGQETHGAVFELSELERELRIAQDEMDSLATSIEGIPDAFTADEIAKVWLAGASQSASSLIGVLQEIRGQEFLLAEAQLNAANLQELRLAREIVGLQQILAATDLLSEATRGLFQTIIDAGLETLAGLESGAITPAGRRPGGGGGRQERQQARRDFRDSIRDMEAELAGATDTTMANATAQATLAEKGREAKSSLDEIARGLSLLAELQVGDIVAPFAETGRQLQETGQLTQLREIQQRGQTALAEALAASGGDPELYRAAAEVIIGTLNLEIEALGQQALLQLGGPRAALNAAAAENFRVIGFLVNNLELLGLTMGDVARTVRDSVLDDLLAIGERQAQRVGDEAALAQFQAQRAAREISLERLKLKLIEAQLLVAGALDAQTRETINFIRGLLALPTAGAAGAGGAPPVLPPFRGGSRGSGASQAATQGANALARALENVARQTEDWLDAGIDPLTAKLDGTVDQFATLGAAVFAAGGSIADLTELEVALQIARQAAFDDALKGVRDRLAKSERQDPGLKPGARLEAVQAQFQASLAATLAAPGQEGIDRTSALFDELEALGGELFTGTGLSAFLGDLRAQFGQLLGLDLPVISQEDLLAEISAKLSTVDNSLGGVSSSVTGVKWAVGLGTQATNAVENAVGETTAAVVAMSTRLPPPGSWPTNPDPDPPTAQAGALVKQDSLIFVHAGERILSPAATAAFEQQQTALSLISRSPSPSFGGSSGADPTVLRDLASAIRERSSADLAMGMRLAAATEDNTEAVTLNSDRSRDVAEGLGEVAASLEGVRKRLDALPVASDGATS